MRRRRILEASSWIWWLYITKFDKPSCCFKWGSCLSGWHEKALSRKALLISAKEAPCLTPKMASARRRSSVLYRSSALASSSVWPAGTITPRRAPESNFWRLGEGECALDENGVNILVGANDTDLTGLATGRLWKARYSIWACWCCVSRFCSAFWSPFHWRASWNALPPLKPSLLYFIKWCLKLSVFPPQPGLHKAENNHFLC